VRHSLRYRCIQLSYQRRWLLQMYTSVSIYMSLVRQMYTSASIDCICETQSLMQMYTSVLMDCICETQSLIQMYTSVVSKTMSHTDEYICIKDCVFGTTDVRICINRLYSLLHLECRFFILKSQSMIWFSGSLLPRSVRTRPRRLRLEIEIEWHSKCNRLYLWDTVFDIDIYICPIKDDDSYRCIHLYQYTSNFDV